MCGGGPDRRWSLFLSPCLLCRSEPVPLHDDSPTTLDDSSFGLRCFSWGDWSVDGGLDPSPDPVHFTGILGWDTGANLQYQPSPLPPPTRLSLVDPDHQIPHLLPGTVVSCVNCTTLCAKAEVTGRVIVRRDPQGLPRLTKILPKDLRRSSYERVGILSFGGEVQYGLSPP